MKKTKITTLTTAALAATILATTNVNNHTVKADSTDDQTATKAQTPKEVAQTNVDNAKKDVENTQAGVDQAQNDLNSAQAKASTAENNYNQQSEAVNKAQDDVNTKASTAKEAQSKADSAASLANEAKDPTKMKAANDAVSNAENKLNEAKNEKSKADKAVADKEKDIKTKSEAVTAAQQAVTSASAAKSDADKAVSDVQEALDGTGINEAKTALDDATKKVNDDTAALNKAKDDQQTQQAAYDKAKKEKDAAEKNLAKAQADQAKAEEDFKQINDKYNAQKNKTPDPVLVELENKLAILKNDSNATITISDVEKYKKAWQDWKDKKFDKADKDYIDSEFNKYQYNGNESDNEEIDITNLNKEQVEELSLFGANLINKVREQLGVKGSPLKVTEGSVSFAQAIAKKVQEDYKSGKWTPGWHDAAGINEVADKWGMQSNHSNPLLKNDSYHSVSQSYEDGENSAPTSVTKITMNAAKSAVFYEVGQMIFASGGYGLLAPDSEPTYEFGHASGILNLGLKDNKFISASDAAVKDSIDDEKNIMAEQLAKQIESAKKYITDEITFHTNILKDNEEEKHKLLNYKGVSDISIGINGQQFNFPEDLQKAENYYNEQIASEEKEIQDLNKKLSDLNKGGEDAKKIASENSLIKISGNDEGLGTWHSIKELEDLIARNESKLKDGIKEYYSNIIRPFGVTSYNIPEYYIINKETSKFSTKIVPNYDEKIKSIENQIQDESNKSHSEPIVTREEVNEAKRKLNDENEALNGLTSEINTATDKLSKINKALTNNKNTIIELENMLSGEELKKSAAQTRYNNLTTSHAELTKKLEAVQQEQITAQANLKQARIAKQSADKNLKAAEKELTTLQANVKSTADKVATAQQAVTNAKNYVNDLNNANSIKSDADSGLTNAKTTLAAAQTKLKVEKQKLPALEKAKQEAEDTIATAQANLDTANAELKIAQEKLTEAQNKLEKLNKTSPTLDTVDSKTSTKKKKTKANSHSKKEEITSVKLTHNAFIYDKNGKVIKSKITIKFIRRGKTIKPVNAKTVTIKGKKYYQVGKNQFIKAANAKIKTHPVKVKAVLKTNFKAVDLNGKHNGKTVKSGKKYHFNEKRTINGKTYYKIIWTNNWIPASKLSIKK